MKILLTGNEGFIAAHLQRQLEMTGHDIVGVDKKNGFDLCSRRVVDTLPDVDAVFHFAAINGTRLFYTNPFDIAKNNTLPTFNLMERYRDSAAKIVFASTCEIFNGAVDNGWYAVPTDESVPVVFNDSTNPRWSYSLPKALGENVVSNGNLDWLILRFFNIYGPGQVDHFINEFVARVSQGEFYITGDDTRSFCYVADAVDLTCRLCMSVSNEIVNVGRTDEVPVSKVASTIMELMGEDPQKLEVREGFRGSVTRRSPDTNRMLELSQYDPGSYTELEEGLKKTIESILLEAPSE